MTASDAARGHTWVDGALPEADSWKTVLAYRTDDVMEAYRLAELGLTPGDVLTARFNLDRVLTERALTPVAAVVLADETATFFQARLDRALDVRSERVLALMDSSATWTFTAVGSLLRITKQRARSLADRARRP